MIRKSLLGSWFLLFCCGCLGACQPAPTSSPASPYPLLVEIDLNYDSPYYSADSLDWNPTSDHIAIGSDVKTYLYSLEDEELRELKEEPHIGALVTWSLDGSKLAGSDRRLWVWDPQTDQIIHNVNTVDTYSHYTSAFWSRDGTSLLSTLYHFNTRTSLIELWDITTGQVRPLEISGTANPIVADWSPDERLAAYVDTNHPDVGPIQIFELSSGQTIHTFTGVEVRPVAWDSSGTQFATSSASDDITVWDTISWQPIVTLPSQGNFERSVRWHPEGDYLAAAGESGVIIWNVKSATSTIVHDQLVLDVAWDSEGRRLATAIQDTVYIWDVAQLP